MNNIYHEECIWEPKENHIYSYWSPIDAKERTPIATWKLNKISIELWESIKHLCAYAQKEYSSECMVRLYFSDTLNEWKTLVYRQAMAGMTVSDEFDQEIRNSIDKSFQEAGSLHHHCKSSAFQSGTDFTDEETVDGLHITLGNLDESNWDIHTRFKTPECFIQPLLSSFIEAPDWIESVPTKYQHDLFFKFITEQGDPNKANPTWCDRLYKKSYVVTNHRWIYGKNGNGHVTPSSTQQQLSLHPEVETTMDDRAQDLLADALVEADLHPLEIVFLMSQPENKLEGNDIENRKLINKLCSEHRIGFRDLEEFIELQQLNDADLEDTATPFLDCSHGY